MFEKSITYKFLKVLENIKFGSITVTTPDNKIYQFKGSKLGLNSDVHLMDWNTIPKFSAKGDIGLAEAYRDGWWESTNLASLMIVALQNETILDSYIYGGWFSKFAIQFVYLFRSNTLKGSQRNIHKHYDLGNDFYALWLDSSMTYSSGLFKSEDETLTQAQHNKYDRILNALNNNSGHLLEIGCGWGGFAEYAVKYSDFKVKGITISDAQHQFAKNRLADYAEIHKEDYRHQQGQYENIVSIEMFEAIGEKYWPVYFKKIKSLLKTKGKALIQTITIDEPYFDRYRNTGDMLRTFIFPGGMLPTISRLQQEAKVAGLKMTNNFAFGHDYARTLRHWKTNFENVLPEIRAMNFDEKFIRIWRYYLATCTAGFETQRTNVVQLEIEHA